MHLDARIVAELVHDHLVFLVHQVLVLLPAEAGVGELGLIEPGVDQVQLGGFADLEDAPREHTFPDADLGADAALGHHPQKLATQPFTLGEFFHDLPLSIARSLFWLSIVGPLGKAKEKAGERPPPDQLVAGLSSGNGPT